MKIESYDGEPCNQCGSTRHGTPSHAKLENAYRRWGLGLMSWGDQTQLGLSGTAGAPSLSEPASGIPLERLSGEGGMAQPDRLRIVPFTISSSGRPDFRSAGILRLWKVDPEGACTFTLSWDPMAALPVGSLGRLFGDPGSTVTVVIESSPLNLGAERPGT